MLPYRYGNLANIIEVKEQTIIKEVLIKLARNIAWKKCLNGIHIKLSKKMT